ncbi:MarR family transcriptional regulator [Amycolatopsis acidiphila]|uniref:MarR family transcriptional regulator n=1 Tax=Amycolatopsis acidiphila TaxID=715473 RepID=A0A557ZYF1_9PSEU|nr:MarR family transcriptional regulator [Amycolatopsis acidiphila]TVT17032.1 MarR family transcriptional regulator [Amycolatopsis acidiphila]UIJ58562.1 MarR family transcriptional regulator [Amycolatopsis acidiphila]GHG76841.1 MarR family transcriptional regulator [Amycolatopsis acidiphila]
MIPHRPVLTLAQAGRIAGALLKEAVASHGLKPGHARGLTLLAERDSMSQQALLEEMGVDASVLVGILNDLEDDGLVSRRRDRADRRRHIVAISARGRKLAERLDESFARVEAELLSGLTADDVATLTSLLGRVKDTGAEDCSAD